MYLIAVYFYEGQQKKRRVIPVTYSIMNSAFLKLI